MLISTFELPHAGGRRIRFSTLILRLYDYQCYLG